MSKTIVQGATSPHALDRRRAVVDALMADSVNDVPQNMGEGIESLGQAIFGSIGNRRLIPHEQQARDQWRQDFAGLWEGFSPSAPAEQTAFTPPPPASVAAPAPPDAAPFAITSAQTKGAQAPRLSLGDLLGKPFHVTPARTAGTLFAPRS